MLGIIVEGVLFIALLAAAGTLLYSVLMRLTPVGRRLAQTRNRELIEDASGRTCPLHGRHEAHELVRLPDGDVMCPQCYQEAMNAH